MRDSDQMMAMSSIGHSRLSASEMSQKDKMSHLKAIAIIPARGGSKRIPKKNIRPFLGKPVIQYSIEIAEKSGCFDKIMVSTENDEIAKIAQKAGAEVPFMRSKINSSDYATLSDVMIEVISNYKDMGIAFDYFCCILPTVPSLSSERLMQGFKILKEKSADAVIPVVEFEYPIQRSLNIAKDGRVSLANPENERKRSQDFSPIFHDAGRFIWVNTKNFLKARTLFMDNVLPIIMPRLDAQDIDTEVDWKMAELKYFIKHKDKLDNKEILKKIIPSIFVVFLICDFFQLIWF